MDKYFIDIYELFKTVSFNSSFHVVLCGGILLIIGIIINGIFNVVGARNNKMINNLYGKQRPKETI